MPRILQFEIDASKQYCRLASKSCKRISGGLTEPMYCDLFRLPLMNEYGTQPCGLLGTPRRLDACLACDKGEAK